MRSARGRAGIALLAAACVAALISCTPLDLFMLAMQVPLINGKTWTGYELVLDIGGTTYSKALANPCAIKDGGTYKMWVGGSAVAPPSTTRIHYSESTDGRTWTAPVVVIAEGAEGTNDLSGVGRPSVLKLGGIYKMWYVGGTSGVNRILYAESSDGRTWSGHSLVLDIGAQGVYDTKNVWAPAVIKDGSIYRMWYSGDNDASERRVLYAESADGLSWSGHRLAVDIGSEGTYDVKSVDNPSVIKDNLLYKMWYNCQDTTSTGRIIYAESSDGITWGSFQLAVDAGNVPGNDDTGAIGPSVISDDGVGRMWYTGWVGTTYRILYAESR